MPQRAPYEPNDQRRPKKAYEFVVGGLFSLLARFTALLLACMVDSLLDSTATAPIRLFVATLDYTLALARTWYGLLLGGRRGYS